MDKLRLKWVINSFQVHRYPVFIIVLGIASLVGGRGEAAVQMAACTLLQTVKKILELN
jgi:ribose/xylose/arabinose/galactoside ABC-type transport system permease subunit